MICLSIKEYQKAIWFVALKHQDTFAGYFFILFVFCFFRQRFDLIFPPKLEEFNFHFIKILLARIFCFDWRSCGGRVSLFLAEKTHYS